MSFCAISKRSAQSCAPAFARPRNTASSSNVLKTGCGRRECPDDPGPAAASSRAALPWTGEMDVKTTRDLALLAVLSLFCAGFAWILDHLVFGLVFFALGVAAALEIAWEP